EQTIPWAVAGDKDIARAANGERGRSPERPARKVAQIKHFSRMLADRIVGPGGDLILPAVHGPCKAAAFGRDVEAVLRIGDHIDPGRRSRLAGTENGDIFLAVIGKSAKAVEKFKVGWQRSRLMRRSRRCVRRSMPVR